MYLPDFFTLAPHPRPSLWQGHTW